MRLAKVARIARDNQVSSARRHRRDLQRVLEVTQRQLRRCAQVLSTGRGDGSGLYLTRAETHEVLARAFDAAGHADSVVTHYSIVERAWRNADPSVRPRYQATRARRATLGSRS